MLARTLTPISPSRALCHIIRGTAWQTSTAPRATRFLHSRSSSHNELLLRRLAYPVYNSSVEPSVKSGEEFQRKHAGAKTAVERRAGVADAYALLLWSHHQVRRLAPRQQRQRAASVRASRILIWLWSLEKSTWEDVMSKDLLDVLCWHLEAEGKDDFIAQWLRLVNTTRSRPQDALIKDRRVRWPGWTLTSHVKAKFYWHKSPDPALKAVFAVIEQDNNIVFWRNTHILITRCLQNPFVPLFPKKAFEKYVQFAQRFSTSPLMDGDYALHHPTDPSADTYLQAWQARPADPDGPSEWIMIARTKIATLHIRAAYILRLQGRNADASWLEQNAKTMYDYSRIWRLTRLHALRDDTKLEKLRSKSPHAQEVEAAMMEEEAAVVADIKGRLTPGPAKEGGHLDSRAA